jgi:hypothetical protein
LPQPESSGTVPWWPEFPGAKSGDNNDTRSNPCPVPQGTIRQAISEGKALVKDGKTKVEATNAMYAKLKATDRETAVAAFMEGTGLTATGAVTYWYNCRRKAAKPAAKG